MPAGCGWTAWSGFNRNGDVAAFAVEDVEAGANDQSGSQPSPEIWPVAPDDKAEKRGPNQRGIAEGGNDRGRRKAQGAYNAEMANCSGQSAANQQQPIKAVGQDQNRERSGLHHRPAVAVKSREVRGSSSRTMRVTNW